jgi:hypothetical protein
MWDLRHRAGFLGDQYNYIDPLIPVKEETDTSPTYP